MKPWQFVERHDNDIITFIARFLDISAFIAGSYLAFVLRDWPVRVDERLYIIATTIAVLLAVIVFPVAGVYRTRRGQSWFRQLQRIFLSWMSVFLTLLIIAFVSKTSTDYSRIWVVSWALTSLLLLVSFRLLLMKALNLSRRKGWNRKKIIIIGAGDLGRSIYDKIRSISWAGLDVVGFVDEDISMHGKKVDDVEILGGVSDIGEIIDRHHPDEVWIAISARDEKLLEDILHQLRHAMVSIRYVPNLFSYRLVNHSIMEIAGLPVINLSETPLYGINHVIKYIEDIVISLIVLILVSPLMLLIACSIKFTSRGPVFYRQERVSWNGRIFSMLKFRSMPVDVEDQTGPVWAKVNESRATTIGAFLRRTSLDELPQFINVLKGDMSIVGPRPERPYFVDKFKDEIPSYMQKHMVKAGITGWAQINGWRGDTDLAKRIEHDIYYIEHWSVWFDLKIIMLTIYKGFINRNAY